MNGNNNNKLIDNLFDRYQILLDEASHAACKYRDDCLNVYKYERYLEAIEELKDIITMVKIMKFPDFGLKIMEDTFTNIQQIIST